MEPLFQFLRGFLSIHHELTIDNFQLLNEVVPQFKALPGFRALKAVDRPSALNPGTTVPF